MSILKSAHLRQIGLYLIFYLVVAVSYLTTISVVSYFHFLLDHDFSTIEDWIFYHYWEIASLSKIFGAVVMIGILNIQGNERNLFKDFFMDSNFKIPKEIYVVITIFFILTFFLYSPTFILNHNATISSVLISFLGTFVFYMSDVFVAAFIHKVYPGTRRYLYLVIFVFSLLQYFFNRGLFLFAKNIDATVFCNIFFLFFLSQWRKLNWIYPGLFCVLFICSFSSLTGTDIMWAEEYAFFRFPTPMGTPTYMGLIFLSVFYLHKRPKDD